MMKKFLILLSFLLALTLPVSAQGQPTGVVVIGDSLSHEYRCVPRGNSTSFNWVEILAQKRAVNFGALNGNCYAYDFAWSGNTITYQMANMVTWAIEEFQDGNVSRVIIELGYNDISNGGNVTTLINTYGAQLDRLIAAGFSPSNILAIALPQEDCSANNSNITSFNSQLQTLAANKGIAFASQSAFCALLNSYAVNSNTYNYGGQSVSRLSWCHINCLRLPNDGHPGTIWQAVFANAEVAGFFGVSPVTEAEVLAMMGIGSSATATPSRTPTVTPTRTVTSTATVTRTPTLTPTLAPVLITCPVGYHVGAVVSPTMVRCDPD